MNKLAGMSKLAGAFHYLNSSERLVDVGGEPDSTVVIFDLFHRLRRSLSINDLEPKPRCTEGFNGRMPTQL